MTKKRPGPIFQKQIAQYLISKHKYGVFEQEEITDTENYISEDHLIAFIKATQKKAFEKLEEDYSTDARDEIFKALRDGLRVRPLWMIIRHGPKVRDLEFKLYYPKPRSSDSIANLHYKENRIAFNPELLIKDQKRPDFAFFLNGCHVPANRVQNQQSSEP